jgi:dsDNA-specific endonuclease/ATPase MutS2
MEAQRRDLESIKQVVYREMMSIITLAETLEAKIFNENEQTQREMRQLCTAIKSHAEFLKGFCA